HAEQRAPDSKEEPPSVSGGEECRERQRDPEPCEGRQQEIRCPGHPQAPGVQDVDQQKRRWEEMKQVSERMRVAALGLLHNHAFPWGVIGENTYSLLP